MGSLRSIRDRASLAAPFGVLAGTTWRPLLPRRPMAFGVAVVLAAVLVYAVRTIPAAHVLAQPFGPFLTIHDYAGTGLFAALIYAVVFLTGAAASYSLLLVEGLSRVFSAAAVAAPLLFAQAAPQPASDTPGPGVDTPSPAQSEAVIGAYFGGSFTVPSDVTLISKTDDTDLTLKDVHWWAESLIESPFYGARGMKWMQTWPDFGTMVDFTHAKATAYDQDVKQSGKLKGKPLPPEGRFYNVFGKLEYTHGMNALTMNGLYRYSNLLPRVRPYFGVGLGVMVPHVDSWRAGAKHDPNNEGYERAFGPQLVGPVLQFLGGLEWRIFVSNKWSAFTEYKLEISPTTFYYRSGAKVSMKMIVNCVVTGIYRYVWRENPAL